MSAIKTGLKKVLYDFVNARFTKSMLREMLRNVGVEAEGRKDEMIVKVLKFYAPSELLARSKIIEYLRWFERLILYVLLSGPKIKGEIAKHELVRKVLSHGIPEAAFGIITSKSLDEVEARRYLLRKVDGLKKAHLLIYEKRSDGRLVYSIHPWFLPYFKEKLLNVNEEDLVEEAYKYARSSRALPLMDMLVGKFWPEWQSSLNNFRETIGELIKVSRGRESQLRFGVSVIPVSLIAEQYYCEKKVEFAYLYGEEKKSEMLLGKEAHEKLLEGTEKVKMKSLWVKVSSGLPVIVREMPLIAKYGDVFLTGLADVVIFKDGEAKILIEYKFTRTQRPWRDHHVQARLYCLLLNLTGFKTQNLKYALVLVPQTCRNPEKVKQTIEKLILKCKNEEVFESKIDDQLVKVFISNFQIKEAKQELEWALKYWMKERQAIPTRKAGKCQICNFRAMCLQP